MSNQISSELASLLNKTYPSQFWLPPENGDSESTDNMARVIREVLNVLETSPGDAYKIFQIPKKNGRFRIIHAPQGDALMGIGEHGKVISKLAHIQSKIGELLSRVPLPREICAFRNGYDGLSYLKESLQMGKNLYQAPSELQVKGLYKIDIRNFFGSIPEESVRRVLHEKLGPESPSRLSHKAIESLCKICCYNGTLTQGPPSSPAIANLVGYQDIDKHLLPKMRVVGSHNKPSTWGWLRYMRYADDIIVIGINTLINPELISIIESAITQRGFGLAEEKRILLEDAEVYPVLGVSVLPNRTFQIPTRSDKDLAYRLRHYSTSEVNSIRGQLSYNNRVSRIGGKGARSPVGLYSPRVAYTLAGMDLSELIPKSAKTI